VDFDHILDQAIEMLQRRGRLTYRTLKRQFELDNETFEDLKEELVYGQRLARDEEERVLVWTGEPASTPSPASAPEPSSRAPVQEPLSYTPRHLAEKILTSRNALEGERKQVTVLFCDLQNSTPLAETIGPENMHALLNRFFEIALSEVHRYEGTINQFLGDGFMALFGAPISHEDHARRGVLSALSLQRTLKEADLGKPYGVGCAFRMGLNSGLVVVGSIGDNLRMDYSAIGDTTNLASRLQAQSDPGEILVSESTARLAEGYIRLEPLEPVEVKGKTEPVSIYKVIGTLPRRSPIVSRSEQALSQFVGRERELSTLEELFAQVKSGQGQVVGIVAEAGQGKSRLLYEFRQLLENKPVTYLEGRCLSYGSSIPYHPIIDIVRNNCGISEGDNAEAIIEKVGIALREVGMDAEASAPYLLRLLGVQEGTESIAMLTPEAIRTRTFDTLRQMSLSGAQRRPLIFGVEDLHWQDKTSEDYMAFLVDSLPGASIMLLMTYRPGYRPPWIEKSYATQISLHSLTSQEALTIVHSVTQDQVLPDHLAQAIVEKSEGNPFFLEELTRAVMEHGDLQAEVIVPDTIQGVLSARIDRLPEAHKRLLQTASVLGREFSPRLLRAIWDGVDSLDGILAELKRMEFLFERTGTEDAIYVFKHALTQDVAYESLLTARRQALHTETGQVLEALYADRLEDVYDRLAHHYSKTGLAAKAVEYLSLVAEKAARVYAHTEAVNILQEALAHAERLSADKHNRTMLDLLIRQADSLFWAGRHEEIVDLLRGQEKRLVQLPRVPKAGQYYFQLSRAYSFLGQREHARLMSLEALQQAQQTGDKLTMAKIHAWLAMEMNFTGDFRHSIEHGQQALSLLDSTQESFLIGESLYFLGLTYAFSGDFSRALELATRLHTIGESVGDRRLQVWGLITIGLTYNLQGEWEASLEVLQHASIVSPDAFETALVIGFLGANYLGRGNLAEAVSTLEQAVDQADQYRSRQVQSWFNTYLSEAYLQNGQIDKAYRFGYQAFTLAENSQHPRGIALAQHILGRIAHASGNLTEAKSHLHKALVTFCSLPARYDLARTHLDLASLAHTQNDVDTATTHLSTAYAWFQKLRIPKWMERTEQLAQEYGVTLTEVKIKVLETEGSS
jgi:class 3 adenylate cyclase/tetratricopeptide (TPR) repeat protein